MRCSRKRLTSLSPFPELDPLSVCRQAPTLQVLEHPNVFSVGDVSETGGPASSGTGGSGAPFPHTAQVAFQQADYVAWNLWSSINKRPLLPFRCAPSLAVCVCVCITWHVVRAYKLASEDL